MPNYRNPFASSSPQGSAASSGGANNRLALDNLIRRELKVGDPNDSAQIASALLERYKGDPRARAISQEAQGLPFLQTVPSSPTVVQAPTSSSAEWEQATSDTNRDLAELTTNPLLKDVTPELQGWAQAIRSALAEGANAARFALDPRQRDKAFAIRRQLGDYARMARLVGALSGPAVSANYRAFAQSLDEAASVLLVMMGEALANIGFAGGKYLLQAPYSELQVRRDAAVYALRNLVGATQEAYGPNDWPRGLDAYRRLFDSLEAQGQGDLRSLLVETELTRTMDELIQRAAHGTVDGLRALGSTAQLDLERFRRLVLIGQRSVSPEAPPLTAFLEALALFADAFQPSGGFRLLRVARPPVLFYGLYGTTTLEDADQRLLQLIIGRGKLAQLLDCLMQCNCGPATVVCQVILDKILCDIDRAIDLYAVGKDDFGEPERRAAAYSYVIEAFRSSALSQPTPGCAIYTATPVTPTPNNPAIGTLLDDIMNKQLRPSLALSDPEIAQTKADLLDFAERVRSALARKGLCGGPDPTSNRTLCDELDVNYSPGGGTAGQSAAQILNAKTGTITLRDLTPLMVLAQQGQARLQAASAMVVPAPSTALGSFLTILSQELCIQEDMEENWENLVRTMAPDCAGLTQVFGQVKGVIKTAIGLVSGIECPPFGVSIPPHFETSLDGIADDVPRTGFAPQRYE